MVRREKKNGKNTVRITNTTNISTQHLYHGLQKRQLINMKERKILLVCKDVQRWDEVVNKLIQEEIHPKIKKTEVSENRVDREGSERKPVVVELMKHELLVDLFLRLHWSSKIQIYFLYLFTVCKLYLWLLKLLYVTALYCILHKLIKRLLGELDQNLREVVEYMKVKKTWKSGRDENDCRKKKGQLSQELPVS